MTPTRCSNLILALHGRCARRDRGRNRAAGLDRIAAVDRDDEGDTIYAIDVVSEAIVNGSPKRWRASTFVHGGRGAPGGTPCLPARADEASADGCIIVDPIDGTRGLMYQKRSAWILTAVAPNRGRATSLRDIVLAVQTEIPLVKQHLSDQLWAVRGGGAHAQRYNRLTGERAADAAATLGSAEHRPRLCHDRPLLPGARDVLAAIDEAIVYGALGSLRPARRTASRISTPRPVDSCTS